MHEINNFISKKMSFSIRNATAADIPAIFELLKAFAVFQKTPEKVLVTPEQMKEEANMFQCFVAVENTSNDIVGFATFFFAYYSWSGKALYLDDLYVRDDFRGQNIGSMLMKSVIDFAKIHHCKKLRWQVSNWNSDAQVFYKKLGAEIDDTEINCDLVF
ncbi:MAG: GNAT family N-acetyltransferase [Panacibacter sp.]